MKTNSSKLEKNKFRMHRFFFNFNDERLLLEDANTIRKSQGNRHDHLYNLSGRNQKPLFLEILQHCQIANKKLMPLPPFHVLHTRL